MSLIADYKGHWELDPKVTFLNHGSLGPTPREVLLAKDAAARRVSKNPLGFMTRELERELELVCQALGKMIRADARDIVLVANATVGMNSVANSLELEAGDEILLNDHEYGAVLRIFRERAIKAGAKLVVAKLPAKFDDPQIVVQSIMNSVTERTKLMVFSHVTSASSIIMPAQEICDAARKLGISTCIDGPHALALTNVSITQLNCDYYVASCHKWLCAPCGTGFLYARKKHQSRIFHPVISWGRSVSGQVDSWKDSFTWPGTFDPAALMAIPAAIQFLNETVGLANFREVTHDLANYAYESISELTGLAGMYDYDTQWYGPMLTIPLPDSLLPAPQPPAQKHQLQHQLQEQFGIEIPIIHFQGKMWIRVSCHIYNSLEQIDYLVSSLKQLIK